MSTPTTSNSPLEFSLEAREDFFSLAYIDLNFTLIKYNQIFYDQFKCFFSSNFNVGTTLLNADLDEDFKAALIKLFDRVSKTNEQSFELIKSFQSNQFLSLGVRPVIDRGSQTTLSYILFAAPIKNPFEHSSDAFLMDSLKQHFEEKEALTNIALNSSDAGLWILDIESGNVSRNEQHDLLYGFKQKQDSSSFELFLKTIHPLDQKHVLEKYESTIRLGLDEFNCDFRVINSDGSIKWLCSKAKVQFNKENLPIKFFGSLVEVTELKETKKQLQKALKLRKDFLALASHELKTPITSLKLQLQVAMRELEKHQIDVPKDFIRFLNGANRQVDYLSELIEELLDLSSIENGQLEIVLEECELSALIKKFIDEDFHYPIAVKPVINFFYDQKVNGFFDRYRVEQILSNLLSNAVKFGEGKPIEVCLKVDRGNAVISVKDDGVGISEEFQEQIFNRFERGENGVAGGGLGLGLYIVRSIVNAHGGNITVMSHPRSGATFFVSLPLSNEIKAKNLNKNEQLRLLQSKCNDGVQL